MHACSESKMPIRLAIKDTAIRVGELLGVTVRGRVIDNDGFTGAESMPAQLDTLRDIPRDAVNRTREPDELFNGPWQDLGFTDEPVAFGRMRSEIVEREGHRARCCLESGLHQEHRVGYDVLERQLLTVDLGVEKYVDHVALRRLGGPRRDRVVEVLKEPAPRRHSGLLGLPVERRVGQLDTHGDIVDGHAKEVFEEDDAGLPPGDLREVAGSLFDEDVDQLVGLSAHLRL
jgi:hypothetical protein